MSWPNAHALDLPSPQPQARAVQCPQWQHCSERPSCPRMSPVPQFPSPSPSVSLSSDSSVWDSPQTPSIVVFTWTMMNLEAASPWVTGAGVGRERRDRGRLNPTAVLIPQLCLQLKETLTRLVPALCSCHRVRSPHHPQGFLERASSCVSDLLWDRK